MSEVIKDVHFGETEIDGDKYLVKTTIVVYGRSVHATSELYKKWGSSHGFISIANNRGDIEIVPPKAQS